MRKPIVENKYELTIPKIKKLKVNREKLNDNINLFWRNNVIGAYCISQYTDRKEYGSYWIGIYDIGAPSFAGKFRFSLSVWQDMCRYDFENFFDEEDIENEDDLILQEKFLTKINELLDLGILYVEDFA